MDVRQLSSSFTVRKLRAEDVGIVYDLSCKNELFYQLHPPFITRESILQDMKALPPQKDYKDKYYLGFFDGSKLIACLDLVLSYPKQDTAYIGFFMVDISRQGCGIGSGIIQEVCNHLKHSGYQAVRLGVDQGNPQSYAFWTKNGFCPIDESTYIVMESRL